jgi:thiosulfate/3-mercaptopyruvate sulfurtransferase
MLPPLIGAAALHARLDDPALYLLDIRSMVDGGGAAAFHAGHVPGATHSDYVEAGWRQKRGAVPGLLPDPIHLAQLIGSLGLEPQHEVVIVYAGVNPSDLAAAARVYWTLKLVGVAQLSILDGGFRAWIADAARPVESGPGRNREPNKAELRLLPGLHSPLDASLAAFESASATFVDTRALSYFHGQQKSPDSRSAGHIPGAFQADYSENYDPQTGGFRPLPQLAARHANLPDGPLISYCNTGHTAALTWFVLSELLERPNTALFDGSMSEWTQDPTRPVAV